MESHFAHQNIPYNLLECPIDSLGYDLSHQLCCQYTDCDIHRSIPPELTVHIVQFFFFLNSAENFFSYHVVYDL